MREAGRQGAHREPGCFMGIRKWPVVSLAGQQGTHFTNTEKKGSMVLGASGGLGRLRI